MNHSLGRDFKFGSFLKFTMPSVIMMMFFALYTIIDGIFISRYVGSNALSATNIVYPLINVIIGIGTMLTAGGSALVSKTLGEGKEQDARNIFSFLAFISVVIGLAIIIINFVFLKPLIYMLGSTEALYKYCFNYAFIFLLASPFILLKIYFDYFLITAGNPKLGLICSLLGGITNIVLDYVFIVPFNMGISGAALATAIGYVVPAIIGVLYFCKKDKILHFIKPKFNVKALLKSCSNGSSEMVTQISNAVTTFLYNITLIQFLGEKGVAAITMILYAQFLLSSAYIGFVSGSSPIIAYNYGSKNKVLLRRIVKYAYTFVGILTILSFIIAVISSTTIIGVFSGSDKELYNISIDGFKIFMIAFLGSGFNIFTSGMFTALSDGKTSAILSLLRTFVFFTIGITILPKLFGVNGVWIVVPVAEALTLIVSILYFKKYKYVYLY